MNQETDPEMEDRKWPTPRIYVASLPDDAGRSYGQWFDAAVDPVKLEESISQVLANSSPQGPEGWAIHDYEGFGQLRLSEYQDLATISRVARGIERYGEPFVHWATIVGADQIERLQEFEESYLGRYKSTAEYGQIALECMGVLEDIFGATPKALRQYILLDAENLVRDMQLNGEILVADGSDGVYIFDMSR